MNGNSDCGWVELLAVDFYPAKAQLVFTNGPTFMHSAQPVSFPNWKAMLASSSLTSVVKSSHAKEIITFLHHCKKCRRPATVEVIKQYLAAHGTDEAGKIPGAARAALRWFYLNGRTRVSGESASDRSEAPPPRLRAGDGPAEPPNGVEAEQNGRGLRPMEPRPAASDLGGPEWEKALVRTMRLRGLLWRSEQTYRGWGMRFAEFIAPRSPEEATDADVGAFLTELAVKNRASPSSQRQALNALVFVTVRPTAWAPRVVTLRCAAGQPSTQTAG